MKTIIWALLFSSVLVAQDGVEKVNVPLTDPSRPARIRVHLMQGGIVIHGGNTKDVVVEARSSRSDGDRDHDRDRDRDHPNRAAGMKRLDLPGNAGLDVTEEDNVVTIKTASWNRPSDLLITVPRRASLQVKCVNNGDVEVDHVDGEIDADNLNGKITLTNVSGSVVAHSLNGSVTVSLDQVDSSKPMSFSTMNGDIDVTLPESVKANVRMKTDNGDIYSDFDVKLNSGVQSMPNESGRRQDGTFHVRFDKTLHGTINGGGPDFQFTSFNGQIYIHKRK